MTTKRLFSILVAAAAAAAAASSASAQYYQMANQLPQLLRPALSSSASYKGWVELTGLAGLGHNRLNDISITTTQGFTYSSWFFMGVGAGVDVMMAQNSQKPEPRYGGFDSYDFRPHSGAKTRVMIPLFTDFRFTIGSPQTASFFADIKVGASWLIGSRYLELANGYLSNATQFFLRPSLGVRIPVSADNPRRAFNVGIAYQLLTSNNNYRYWDSESVTLNNLGITVSYEW